MSDPDLDVAFDLGYAYAQRDLVPALELSSILFGMLTMALIMACYAEMRTTGIRRTLLSRKRVALGTATFFLYAMFTAHWALTIRHTYDLLFGGWLVPHGFQGTFDAAPDNLQPNFGPFVLESFMFGAFSALVVYAIYLFTQGISRARLQMAMLSAALIMYAISLAHFCVQVRYIAADNTLEVGGSHFFEPGVAPLALVSMNVIFSDAIVLWRACVVWRQNMVVYSLAAVLLALSIALNITNIAEEARIFSHTRDGDDDQLFIQPAFSDSAYGTTALVLSLVTNLAATVAIGWKTWIHRQKVLKYLRTSNSGSIADKVMTLLWESGCVYSLIWILYIISSKSTLLDIPDHDTSILEDTTSPVLSVEYFNRLMAQLTGIYPTLILVVVALERKHLDNAAWGPNISSLIHTPPRSDNRPGAPFRPTKSRRIGSHQSGSPSTRTYGREADEDDVGKAVFVSPTPLDENPPPAIELPTAKTFERASLLSMDNVSQTSTSTVSVPRPQQNTTSLVVPSTVTGSKALPAIPRAPLPGAAVSRSPGNMAQPPTRSLTQMSSGGGEKGILAKDDQHGSIGVPALEVKKDAVELELYDMTRLVPNRRAPSPLFD
ncbi:unnamed protein product [Peniophora sp. CBMAI 1063]|nr:unnamed protein product [Peniophora sp. CBMAI 1063]